MYVLLSSAIPVLSGILITISFVFLLETSLEMYVLNTVQYLIDIFGTILGI